MYSEKALPYDFKISTTLSTLFHKHSTKTTQTTYITHKLFSTFCAENHCQPINRDKSKYVCQWCQQFTSDWFY